MPRDANGGAVSSLFRRLLGPTSYQRASRAASRNLSAVISHHQRAMRDRDRLIDVAAIEREYEESEQRLFFPDPSP